MWHVPISKATTNGVLMTGGLAGGALVGAESLVGREARLRLFCPRLGTADALDDDTDDIVGDGDV